MSRLAISLGRNISHCLNKPMQLRDHPAVVPGRGELKSELDIDMRFSKSALLTGAMLTAMAAGTLVASGAAAASTTYVACNRYNECWKVHEKYDRYPADERIVIRSSGWYDAHQHDTQLRWLNDPANDAGFYDKDGRLAAVRGRPSPASLIGPTGVEESRSPHHRKCCDNPGREPRLGLS